MIRRAQPKGDPGVKHDDDVENRCGCGRRVQSDKSSVERVDESRVRRWRDCMQLRLGCHRRHSATFRKQFGFGGFGRVRLCLRLGSRNVPAQVTITNASKDQLCLSTKLWESVYGRAEPDYENTRVRPDSRFTIRGCDQSWVTECGIPRWSGCNSTRNFRERIGEIPDW